MRRSDLLIAAAMLLFFTCGISAQDFGGGRLSGNFQVDAQYYRQDSTIGADNIPGEKMLSNSFLNLIYNMGSFEVGLRYEAYLGPISGFDPRYEGQGISYRYANYSSDMVDITAGDFYEQFGSGLIFRAYEERQLGYDNAVDGVRVKFRPDDAVEITGLIGKQRQYWDKGEGIVRAGDISVTLTDLIKGLLPEEYHLTVGGSAVSKYEDTLSTFYHLPANVFAWSGRIGLSGYSFTVDAEYAYKYNDPHQANFFNYNPGTGLILSGSYFTTGLGIALNLHRVDNMDYRSGRGATQNDLLLNFIPPLTKQHTYRLATVYPYATQLNGEVGAQAEITYKFPRNSTLGGKYGTSLAANFSAVKAIDTTHTMLDTATGRPFEYDSPFFTLGDRSYFRDFNLELSKRWSKKLKTTFSFINLLYDRDVIENQGAAKYGQVDANIAVAEVHYKISSKHSLRTEIQHMWANQDSAFKEPDFTYGNWMVLLLEYTIAPSWYFSVWDEFNYFSEEVGSETHDRSLHYLNASVAFVHEATRVSLGYGRQREGILCVGGVCRQVPAANGFFLSVTSSF